MPSRAFENAYNENVLNRNVIRNRSSQFIPQKVPPRLDVEHTLLSHASENKCDSEQKLAI